MTAAATVPTVATVRPRDGARGGRRSRPRSRTRLLARHLPAVLTGTVTTYALGVAGLTVGAPVVGWSSSVVVSGSMTPAVGVGDLVLAAPRDREQARSEVQVGDVVVADTTSGRLTHRVVGVTAEGWRTKGDANRMVDSDVVTPEQLVGEVVLVVPVAGMPAVWARSAWHAVTG